MKRIYVRPFSKSTTQIASTVEFGKRSIANILILLVAVTTTVSAGDNVLKSPPPPPDSSALATTDQAEIDPTLAFFTALSSCTPGMYSEKNVISTEVGQSMLSQQIIGPSDDKLTCNVKLSTPDDRIMNCAFPMNDLSDFSESHFLRGMLDDTADNPSQDSLNADMLWSQMKMKSCNISE